MKKTLLLCLILTISSCALTHETEPLVTFENEALTKEFLLNETWYLRFIYSIEEIDFNGNGEKSSSFTIQIPECKFDDIYIFENGYSNTVKLDENEFNCNKNEESQTTSLNYVFEPSKKTLNLGKLIGLENNYTLQGLEFLLDVHDGDKVIFGSFSATINNVETYINYSLINNEIR